VATVLWKRTKSVTTEQRITTFMAIVQTAVDDQSVVMVLSIAVTIPVQIVVPVRPTKIATMVTRSMVMAVAPTVSLSV